MGATVKRTPVSVSATTASSASTSMKENSPCSKALKILGATPTQVARSKALLLLGVSEDHVQESRKHFPLNGMPNSPKSSVSSKACGLLGATGASIHAAKAFSLLGCDEMSIIDYNSRALSRLSVPLASTRSSSRSLSPAPRRLLSPRISVTPHRAISAEPKPSSRRKPRSRSSSSRSRGVSRSRRSLTPIATRFLHSLRSSKGIVKKHSVNTSAAAALPVLSRPCSITISVVEEPLH